MNYHELQPSPSLARFVRCYWELEDATCLPDRSAERIIPDGCMEIVVNIGDPFRGYRDGIMELRPNVVLVGEVRRHVIVHPSEMVHLFGVRFHPGGAYPFFDSPVNEVADMMIDMRDLWGGLASEIHERVCEGETREERARHLEEILLTRLCEKRMGDPAVEWGVRAITARGGDLSIPSIADRVGLSERQFERRFRSAVGIGPKAFARVARFQRIFRSFEQHGIRRSWAEIALDCGYYDQAHFIHDFKAFSGQTPAAYFADHHAMADHFLGIGDMK